MKLLYFVVFTIGVSFIYIELHNANAIQKSRFSYTLNKDFENNAIDTAMATDIEANKPILIGNGGRWEERQLINYLGFFELMQDYMDAGTLNRRDVFDNYSDDILSAYNHPEIKKYIQGLRTTYKDSSYYEKFEKLAKKFAAADAIKK